MLKLSEEELEAFARSCFDGMSKEDLLDHIMDIERESASFEECWQESFDDLSKEEQEETIEAIRKRLY